jgi:SAM-dependent methyltransferase
MEPLFASPTLAEGYARWRPAVHPRVMERVRRHLGGTVEMGLDVGCGAGLSTRALQMVTERAVGLEPLEPMLAWTREVAPGASFVVGRAEAMPVAAGSIDVMTAAGSLNYVDLGMFFAEARRVLRADGLLVVYDFSAGKRMAGEGGLAEWFAAFRRRYPPRPSSGRPLDPGILATLAEGFRVDGEEVYEEAIEMTPEAYVDYMMTETNVAAAVRAGAREEGIRAWCAESLGPVFGGRSRAVLFDGYIAYLRPGV